MHGIVLWELVMFHLEAFAGEDGIHGEKQYLGRTPPGCSSLPISTHLLNRFNRFNRFNWVGGMDGWVQPSRAGRFNRFNRFNRSLATRSRVPNSGMRAG